MLPVERKSEIMRLIRRDHSVKVNELAEQFEVTEETIRRDLDKLEKEGKVKKTYGGAIITELVSYEPSFYDRQKVNMTQKRVLASYANDLIQDGETVFIDMSTTALEAIKSIDDSKNVTVITNSLNALVELSQRKNINLIAIGGTFNDVTYSMEGPMTLKFLNQYYVDKILFSVKGISMERGVMDPKENTVEIKQAMVKNSRQVILFLDETKFGNSALISTVEMDQIDIIVTDYEMDEEWEKYFEKYDIQVIKAV